VGLVLVTVCVWTSQIPKKSRATLKREARAPAEVTPLPVALLASPMASARPDRSTRLKSGQTDLDDTDTHTQREMCTRRCGTGESVPAIVPLTLLHAVPPGKGNPLVSLFLF